MLQTLHSIGEVDSYNQTTSFIENDLQTLEIRLKLCRR